MNISVDTYNNRLRSFIKELEAKNRPLAVAVQSTTIKVSQRIFIQGRKSDGSPIGNYDTTKPLYVDPLLTPGNTSGLKPPRGKNGDTAFSDGTPHKTTYVKSYKELRKIIGRKTDKIDLKFSYDLFFDFTKGKLGTGMDARPTKKGVHVYTIQLDGVDKFTRVNNITKMQGLNERFGTISALSKEEHKHFTKTCLLELMNDLTKNGLA